jgi:oligopeptidase B
MRDPSLLDHSRPLVDSRIADNNGSLEWAADSRALLYVWLDEEHRPRRVLRHSVGADTGDDIVHEQDDPGYFLGLSAKQDRRFLLLSVHDHETAEVSLIDAAERRLRPALWPGGSWSTITPSIIRMSDSSSSPILMARRITASSRRRSPVPAARIGARSSRTAPADSFSMSSLSRISWCGSSARTALPRIVVRHFDSGAEHAIAFDEEAYAVGISAGYEYDTTTLSFTYSSMTTPAQVFDYDMIKCTRVLRKTQEVPSGHDPSHYVTRRVMAPAKDGETVPVSLLYRKDTKLDGSAPLLLYGYGAYGMSMPAGFSTDALSFVDRGFVYAIAHARGGKDTGYLWYTEGKREKKINTFTDFIATSPHGAIQSRAGQTTKPSPLIRPITTCRRRPIRTFSRLLASLTRASPIGSRRNGWRSCVSSPRATGSSYCAPTWRRPTPERPAGSSG